jgi:hypothetical protein
LLRDIKRKLRAFAGLAFDTNVAAVGVHNSLCNGKSQPGAAFIAIS